MDKSDPALLDFVLKPETDEYVELALGCQLLLGVLLPGAASAARAGSAHTNTRRQAMRVKALHGNRAAVFMICIQRGRETRVLILGTYLRNLREGNDRAGWNRERRSYIFQEMSPSA